MAFEFWAANRFWWTLYWSLLDLTTKNRKYTKIIFDCESASNTIDQLSRRTDLTPLMVIEAHNKVRKKRMNFESLKAGHQFKKWIEVKPVGIGWFSVNITLNIAIRDRWLFIDFFNTIELRTLTGFHSGNKFGNFRVTHVCQRKLNERVKCNHDCSQVEAGFSAPYPKNSTLSWRR